MQSRRNLHQLLVVRLMEKSHDDRTGRPDRAARPAGGLAVVQPPASFSTTLTLSLDAASHPTHRRRFIKMAEMRKQQILDRILMD